jgi:3-methyl-2-oxobutanoate hydroxymethyltransferase
MSESCSARPAASAARKVTVRTLAALRARGEKAVFVTAYDYPTAVFADRAGVDMILVGDSAAMTMLLQAALTPSDCNRTTPMPIATWATPSE